MTYQISCATLTFLVVLTGTVLAADVNPLDKSPGAKEMTTDSGLKYVDVAVGNGREAAVGDTATVHYTGRLVDGKKFDSSLDRNEPFSFRVGSGQVIKGWDEGVVQMKLGEKAKLDISSDFAYGSQ